MFQNWGFLITEIAVLLLIAALLGLFIGWLIWGRCCKQVEQLTTELSTTKRKLAEKENDLTAIKRERDALKIENEQAQAALVKSNDKIDAQESIEEEAEEISQVETPTPTQASLFTEEASVQHEEARPVQLTAPRNDKADDLKKIKGIGPQLEKLCHQLGFFHFDQIAVWTEKEIAWVDENLGSFSGRVIRDDWVGQAKKLAAGEETEFSERVNKGEVY